MPHCPKCQSRRTIKRGSRKRPDRYQCKQCHDYFTDRGAPKVLVFDIETLPLIVTSWGVGKTYLSHDNILEDYAILSWSAKWLFDEKVMADILTPKEAQTRFKAAFTGEPHNADERIVKRIWKLLDEADVVITQNGVRFDSRKLNTRFLLYGLPPPHPYHHIDTLLACNAAFDPSSRKLDYMTKFLSLPHKLETEYKLWLDCMRGTPKALSDMLTYNKNDIWILEDYYAQIRAWIPNHPNFSAYTNNYVEAEDEHCCPVCRHVLHESSLTRKYRTPAGYLYKSFRCPHCGVTGRLRDRIPGQSIAVQRAG